jgi:hypothetical protein
MKLIDLTGQRFGRLTVIGPTDRKSKSGDRYWKCICDCGNDAEVLGACLRHGNTKSCGCYVKEFLASGNRRTHGGSSGGKHERLYGVWCAMKNRCKLPSVPDYYRYGGRGISVCAEWANDYQAFREWAYKNGYDDSAPRGKCTVDRVDNERGYSPDNCRIVTIKEQMSNKCSNHLVTYMGETMTALQAYQKYAIKNGVKYGTLIHRLNHGWSDSEAIETRTGEQRYGK